MYGQRATKENEGIQSARKRVSVKKQNRLYKFMPTSSVIHTPSTQVITRPSVPVCYINNQRKIYSSVMRASPSSNRSVTFFTFPIKLLPNPTNSSFSAFAGSPR